VNMTVRTKQKAAAPPRNPKTARRVPRNRFRLRRKLVKTRRSRTPYYRTPLLLGEDSVQSVELVAGQRKQRRRVGGGKFMRQQPRRTSAIHMTPTLQHTVVRRQSKLKFPRRPHVNERKTGWALKVVSMVFNFSPFQDHDEFKKTLSELEPYRNDLNEFSLKRNSEYAVQVFEMFHGLGTEDCEDRRAWELYNLISQSIDDPILPFPFPADFRPIADAAKRQRGQKVMFGVDLLRRLIPTPVVKDHTYQCFIFCCVYHARVNGNLSAYTTRNMHVRLGLAFVFILSVLNMLARAHGFASWSAMIEPYVIFDPTLVGMTAVSDSTYSPVCSTFSIIPTATTSRDIRHDVPPGRSSRTHTTIKAALLAFAKLQRNFGEYLTCIFDENCIQYDAVWPTLYKIQTILADGFPLPTSAGFLQSCSIQHFPEILINRFRETCHGAAAPLPPLPTDWTGRVLSAWINRPRDFDTEIFARLCRENGLDYRRITERKKCYGIFVTEDKKKGDYIMDFAGLVLFDDPSDRALYHPKVKIGTPVMSVSYFDAISRSISLRTSAHSAPDADGNSRTLPALTPTHIVPAPFSTAFRCRRWSDEPSSNSHITFYEPTTQIIMSGGDLHSLDFARVIARKDMKAGDEVILPGRVADLAAKNCR